MSEKSVIDTELLQQYVDSLGVDGLKTTLATFDGVIQEYAKLIHTAAKERKEDELRKQAHKVKGACSSVGLSQLAEMMKRVEKKNGSGRKVERWLIEWADDGYSASATN